MTILRPLRRFALLALVYLPVIFFLQYRTGVYRSELSHHPDESAHVVTSLMIHDYLRSGLGTSPLRFAENYYIHYPKVAFGIWPPVFHSTAAVWMLLVGRTQAALLILVAIQCALCAATLAVFAGRLLPGRASFGLGLFMILMPAFQNIASLVMVDLLLTAMQLWAMLLMISFFRTGRMATAVWFGIVTSLALLTKGNANALLLGGMFMLLLTREWPIFKKPAVYAAGVIVLFLGLPWQVITLRFFKGTVPMDPLTPVRFWMLFSGYTRILVERLSLPVLLFALLGLAVECGPMLLGRRTDRRMLDIAGAGSLVAAIFLFHCIAPNPGPDDRYMVPVLPLLLLFAALGIRWMAAVVPVPRLSLTAKAAVLTLFCLAWFAAATFSMPHLPPMGFAQISARLLPARSGDDVVLGCSDSLGEGAFITAMDLADRPGYEHIVLRGSKTLSENPWDVIFYNPLFKNAAELELYLERTPVDAVVVDLSHALWEQDRDLLLQTIRNNPDKWSMVSEILESGGLRHLQLYRWTGPDHSNIRKDVRVRMRLTLGRDLQTSGR